MGFYHNLPCHTDQYGNMLQVHTAESWPPTLNTCVNKDNTCFDKNVGVVTVNTSCSTLPLCEPIDVNDPQAYFQTVDAVLQLGVPNHRGRIFLYAYLLIGTSLKRIYRITIIMHYHII